VWSKVESASSGPLVSIISIRAFSQATALSYAATCRHREIGSDASPCGGIFISSKPPRSKVQLCGLISLAFRAAIDAPHLHRGGS